MEARRNKNVGHIQHFKLKLLYEVRIESFVKGHAVLKVLVYKRIKFGLHFILCLTLWRRVTHTLRRRVMVSVPERSSVYASANYGSSCTAL